MNVQFFKPYFLSFIDKLQARGYITLEDFTLAPSEVETFESLFIQKLNDPSFAQSFIEGYMQPVYNRIREIEERHNPLEQGDLVLLRAAADPNGEGFDRLLKDSDILVANAKFSMDAGRPIGVGTFFVAAKFLIGIPERQILQDEIEKELRHKAKERGQRSLSLSQKKGKPGRQARQAASKRVKKGKLLSLAQYPLMIRGFLKGISKQSPSRWVKVTN